MRQRGVVCFAVAVIVLLTGAVLQGCLSSKTLKTLQGTTVTDLPPVPIELSRETECATPRYSTRCASVPSGTNNCLALLRGESELQLSRLIGEEIEKQVTDKGSRTSRGSDQGKGTISEDATRSWNYESTVSGNM